MGIFNLKLFNYFRRYKWTAANFDTLQASLLGYPQTLLAAMCQDAILSGLDQAGSTGLSVNFTAGIAINSLGDLLAIENPGAVVVTNNIKSLIVVRPVVTSTNTIVRPTAPFDPVFLNTEQTAIVVKIDGDISNYPSKAAGDVILFGVVASSGAIVLTDLSLCELFGKSLEVSNLNPYNFVVGNRRNCTHRTLALALADAADGDRVRVMDSETVDTTLSSANDDFHIDFDPGVTFSKGTATTGLTLSGDGARVNGGRFTGFASGGNKAISLTGNFITILGTRFLNNDTDIDDTTGTNSLVGVINE